MLFRQSKLFMEVLRTNKREQEGSIFAYRDSFVLFLGAVYLLSETVQAANPPAIITIKESYWLIIWRRPPRKA